MPIPPRQPFLTITCPSCGWNTVIRQRSDALIVPSVCPVCGHENLTRSLSSHIQTLTTHPASYLEALLKNRKL
jgi:predicted RNA-binding Zn-ribbon protein involved in translation (DUF1610 family)